MIRQISVGTYVHISYLETKDFGKVACNGMVLVNNKAAIVLETTVDHDSSAELIGFIQNELKADIKAVIAHHFHMDCIGGLEAFHSRTIPSYANKKTIDLCIEKGSILPQNAIESTREFKYGQQKISSSYFGPAHTVDNIVTYVPAQNLLFGGCMVKALSAGKGNLADADAAQWPETIRKIRNAYPEIKLVVPGHGPDGNADLLDYTIELFSR